MAEQKTDEVLDNQEEEQVAPETQEEEVQSTEEEAPEGSEEEEGSEGSEDEEVEEKPEPKPSRRENLRIQKLIEGLREQSRPTTTPQSRVEGLNYGETLEADPEVIARLEADRKKVGETEYSRGIKQAESMQFHTRLEIDAPKVESKYSILNKEDEANFNPPVAGAISNWYLATVGYDPATNTVQNANVRYAEFVDGIMELANAIAGEKTAKSSKSIAKQAANSGLRPDGSTSKRLNLNKAPDKMSDEELEAMISQAIPKR